MDTEIRCFMNPEGRADQTTKVKGMCPSRADRRDRQAPFRTRTTAPRRHTTDETDAMTLPAETAAASEALREEIAGTLRAVTKLGGAVELVSLGALPNDGKVIADER
ncbi:hypothetical protein XH97_04890 [Bradyrhizobium sp. CCBAU 53380]|nr:hypothetical protein [Bradyrhizobium sp. CCBAU 53380]